MPGKRNGMLAVRDIIEAIADIREFTEGISFEGFSKDKKGIAAVVQKLGVIGEAAKNIGPDIKRDHPDVDWRAVAGMRNKLVHEYFGVSISIIWKTISEDLPVLEKAVKDYKTGKEPGR